MSSSNPYHNYQSAVQWANKQNQNRSDTSNVDHSINIFWVVIVVLLLLLAGWWWWTNYRSAGSKTAASPMNDLKDGAKKPDPILNR